jgi:hypothetical protein
LPDRKYSGFWHRILHDQTADGIERAVSRLPHANVTTVPFHFTSRKDAKGTGRAVEPVAAAVAVAPHPVMAPGAPSADRPQGPPLPPDGTVPIGTVTWRQQVQVQGRVRTLRVQPLAGTATLECVLEDDSGAISLVFLGRNKVPGIDIGTRLRARGVAGEHRRRLAILNPAYQLLTNR